MMGVTEIILKEQLDPKREESFDAITIRYKDNLTIMQIDIKDQAHLHGILNLIRDLNLKLISVNRVEAG